MDVEQLMKLIDKVSESDLTGFKYEENGVKLQLSKKADGSLKNVLAGVGAGVQNAMLNGNVAAGANGYAVGQDFDQAAAGINGYAARPVSEQENGQEMSAVSQPSTIEETGNLVKAPLVGTFYAAPAEDAAPFIQVGDSVKKGQSVAIIEAMKLMNEIESDYDGTVTEILVKNGQAVEYGQPLFRIA